MLAQYNLLGGEEKALAILEEKLFTKDNLANYLQINNLLEHAGTKISPYLANGCLSPRLDTFRLVYWEVKRWEKENTGGE